MFEKEAMLKIWCNTCDILNAHVYKESKKKNNNKLEGCWIGDVVESTLATYLFLKYRGASFAIPVESSNGDVVLPSPQLFQEKPHLSLALQTSLSDTSWSCEFPPKHFSPHFFCLIHAERQTTHNEIATEESCENTKKSSLQFFRTCYNFGQYLCIKAFCSHENLDNCSPQAR